MSHNITKPILLLLVICLISCSDKSTDNGGNGDGNHYELRHARLYAHVEFGDNTPIENTRIWMFLYNLPNDTIPVLSGTPLTDEYGNTVADFAVLTYRDTVISYVQRTGYMSDTIIFRVNYDGQVFLNNYTLLTK